MPSPHLRIPRRKPQPEFRHRHHSKTISVYVPVPALLSTSVSCVCISVDVRVCASIYACDCVCACLCLRLCLWLWLCPRLRWLVWLWNSGLRMRAFWENLVISLSWGCHACGRSSLLEHAVESRWKPRIICIKACTFSVQRFNPTQQLHEPHLPSFSHNKEKEHYKTASMGENPV